MTRKMKKVLALVLSLAMVLSTVVLANADDPTDPEVAESVAGIQFTPDREEGVTDPEGPDGPAPTPPAPGETPPPLPTPLPSPDPDATPSPPGPEPTPDPGDPGTPIPEPTPDPEDPDNQVPVLSSMGINFWQHDIGVAQEANRTFHSIRERNGGWDMWRYHIEGRIILNNAGEAVLAPNSNVLPEVSVAGMLVYALEEWRVDVELGYFYIQNPGAAPNTRVMVGTRLDLAPHSYLATNNFAPSNAPIFNIIALDVNGAADTIASGGGFFDGGANFEGALNVLAGTALQGQAQAELTWTFMHEDSTP